MESKTCQARATKYLSNIHNEEGLSSCLRSFDVVRSSLPSFHRSSSTPSKRTVRPAAARMRTTTWGQVYTVPSETISANEVWSLCSSMPSASYPQRAMNPGS
ncbi:hypothetical protein EUGRSUZ_I02128 [Eucalyptus grandis]|uniref:Uncharacterized protein n=2 Tax=Eucalyptus grandis TaxID=71139 RepID=A0ACC3JIS4_EUCGR|nr:hypothetical protein EUGRSUZ_I02128 [Eucalyptus grandis]